MKRIKIIRLITSNYCVTTHLHNVLNRVPDNIDLIVIGDDVLKFSNKFKDVQFINIPIKRNFNLLYDFICFFKLIFLFKKINPDISHSIMTKAGLFNVIICKLLFIKSVHTFTGQIWKTKKGIKRFLLKVNDFVIANLSTKCLTDSFSQSDFLFKNNIKKNKKRIDVLGNGSISGVDFNVFSKENRYKFNRELRSKFSIPIDAFVITYLARKSIDKGALDILRIYKELLKHKDIYLFYGGPDESEGKVSDFISKNPHIKKRLIELDYIDNHFKYLSIGNLNCLPSHREGFGSIIIDSSALGIPSIGYRIPGLIDSIKDGYSGFLIEEGNIKDFVEKIMYLINDANELDKMSLQSYQYCKKNYDADLLNNLKYKYYEKIL